MSIYFGNDTVNDLYIGLTPVTKGYVGTHLFYNGDNTIIDLTYEKYILNTQFSTLYNTEEKPVKSAILKGQTLINYATDMTFEYVTNGNYCSGILKNSEITSNKTITIVNNNSYAITGVVNNLNNAWVKNVNIKANSYLTLTLSSSEKLWRIRTLNDSGVLLDDFVNSRVIIYDGNFKNTPYFEGMQSVKMPFLTTVGKNLFEPSCIPYNGSEYNDFKKAYATSIRPILRLKPNTTYYIHGEIVQVPKRNTAFKFVDSDGVEIQGTYVSMNNTDGSDYKTIIINNKFTTKTDGNVYFNTFPAYSQEDLDKLKSSFLTSQIQIEEGSTLTTYEPYKSNILTVNEEVELRGVGEVKDELNLLTGELTQHIGKVVLNGSESWNKWFHSDNIYRFHVNVSNLSTEIALVVCDKMNSLGVTNKENIYISSGRINVIFDNSTGILPDDTVSSFKTWLSTNVLTVVYPMVQPTVKTVDLSVVDQDGSNTKLSTFNDLTHVTLSSEELIPEAELEVATKNEEVLNTMSLEMNDISATQTTLEETSNTQSENVDATMIATTEIYEQLL